MATKLLRLFLLSVLTGTTFCGGSCFLLTAGGGVERLACVLALAAGARLFYLPLLGACLDAARREAFFRGLERTRRVPEALPALAVGPESRTPGCGERPGPR